MDSDRFFSKYSLKISNHLIIKPGKLFLIKGAKVKEFRGKHLSGGYESKISPVSEYETDPIFSNFVSF